MLLKIVLATVALTFFAQVGAQASAQVFKCKDASGKITYSSRICSEIGLTSAGEVTGQINMIPASKPSSALTTRPSTSSTPAPVARAASTAAAPKAAASADASAQEPRRCFVVTRVIKTPKGNQTVKNTRCDGDPADAGS